MQASVNSQLDIDALERLPPLKVTEHWCDVLNIHSEEIDVSVWRQLGVPTEINEAECRKPASASAELP